MKRKKWIGMLLLMLVLALSGCEENGELYVDGHYKVTPQMDETISTAIIRHYAPTVPNDQKTFEEHYVFGTSESNGVMKVYLWSLFGSFRKETGTNLQSAHSLPVVITLKKDGKQVSILSYQEPEDGDRYAPSLEKMFPERYRKEAEKAGHLKELEKRMKEKAKKWLKGS